MMYIRDRKINTIMDENEDQNKGDVKTNMKIDVFDVQREHSS